MQRETPGRGLDRRLSAARRNLEVPTNEGCASNRSRCGSCRAEDRHMSRPRAAREICWRAATGVRPSPMRRWAACDDEISSSCRTNEKPLEDVTLTLVHTYVYSTIQFSVRPLFLDCYRTIGLRIEVTQHVNEDAAGAFVRGGAPAPNQLDVLDRCQLTNCLGHQCKNLSLVKHDKRHSHV